MVDDSMFILRGFHAMKEDEHRMLDDPELHLDRKQAVIDLQSSG